MRIILSIIFILLITTNANANYGSGMGAGLAVGVVSGVAIGSSQKSSSIIKEVDSCEDTIKTESFPNNYQRMSYEDKLYTCLQLKEIWSNLTLATQIFKLIAISIFIGFIGFMVYIIRDLFF